MAIKNRLLGFSFSFSIFLYLLLYFGYILMIVFGHSTYNVVSVTAILVPYILLLFMVIVLWKRANIRNNRSVKKELKLLTVIGTIPLLICLVMLGINEYKTNFTTEKWTTNMSKRVHIVDDLINTYDLKGKSNSEVVTLLGPPTETEYFKSESNVVYYLGTERGMIPIDSEWLVIEFDGNQIVKSYDVRTD